MSAGVRIVRSKVYFEMAHSLGARASGSPSQGHIAVDVTAHEGHRSYRLALLRRPLQIERPARSYSLMPRLTMSRLRKTFSRSGR